MSGRGRSRGPGGVAAAFAVFAREFRLRRILLLGALLVGLAAPIIPRLQGQMGAHAADASIGAALLLGLLTCGVFALVLGSGAIARDLADGRLGFDFARPIPAFAIWAGRFGAALALLAASALLVIAPALLFGGELSHSPVLVQDIDWLANVSALGALALGLLGCVGLLFLTHAATVLFASRSVALGFDLAGLVAVGLLAGAAISRLHRAWARDALEAGWIALFALVLLALIAASLAQLLVGRTDLARGHRALSLALWGILLAGGLALEASSRWVVAADVLDLTRIDQLVASSRGAWFEVAGPARGRGDYEPRFLVDGATGRTVRLGALWRSDWFPLSFSADGRSAVWVEAEPGEGAGDLHRLDLRRTGSMPESLRVALPSPVRDLDLSPTGRWVAVLGFERLLVFEVSTGRLMAAVPLSGGAVYEGFRMAWVGPDRLRWFTKLPSDFPRPSDNPLPRIEIAELALPSGKPAKVGEIATEPLGFNWAVSANGGTVLVRDFAKSRRLLFDGATGASLGAIDGPRESFALLLSGNRIAVTGRT
ncbi:MAG TPA: hypothetical protein VN783_14085, partial [Thermoanaerobaculia bacterium]|nr:hypothetical protein [Thermoanaerobaculia bacterium]